MQRHVVCVLILAIAASMYSQLPPAGPSTQPPAVQQYEDLQSRVEKLEKADEKSAPAWVAFYGVIIAAIIAGVAALIGQNVNAKKQRELDQRKALFDQAERLLEFRIKQLESFYAPMFALLEQSRALYDKLQHQLSRDEPSQYRLLDKPDHDGYRMHVRENGDWKGFRLLDKLPLVRTNPKALNLVEQILSIGRRMTEIISTNAGLASAEILPLLGQYMAHYAILSTMHERGETEPYPAGWHTMGYYPRQLNQKIEGGYRELSEFVDTFAEASKRVISELAT